MSRSKIKNGGNRGGGARVTQQDIAEEVGLSTVSVSLALRNSPRISEATRAKVHRVAKKMGYSPDPMLQSLSSYRRSSERKPVDSVVAWLTGNTSAALNEYQAQVKQCREGASEAARLAGYRIDSFDVSGMRPARLGQILEARGISGILIPPDVTLDLMEFPVKNFATVRIGGPVLHADTHRVSPSHTANLFKAYEKMMERGFGHIGYVTSSHSIWGTVSRYISRLQGNLADGAMPLLMLDGEGGEQCAQLKDWIRSNRLDAVISDLPHLEERMEQLGCEVPENLGLASIALDDSSVGLGVNPRLIEVGRAAFSTLNQMLLQRMRGIPEIPYSVMVEGFWQEEKTESAAGIELHAELLT